LSQDDAGVGRHLGKAFGTAGAVAGSEELIESLIQFARPYIYTTSQPLALVAPR
jgi:8-amino-7-oxononanoate synthase